MIEGLIFKDVQWIISAALSTLILFWVYKIVNQVIRSRMREKMIDIQYENELMRAKLRATEEALRLYLKWQGLKETEKLNDEDLERINEYLNAMQLTDARLRQATDSGAS